MATYAEFRLRIEPGSLPGSYRVEASGLAGEDEGDFTVPFTDTELENFVLKVGRTRRGVRRIESPEMQMARAFGGQLFNALMQEKIGALYRSAMSEARALGQGLRVTLSLTSVPELGAIPWEYLYDDPTFLAISTETPVVRYLDLPKPRRALEMTLPLRILGIVSAPSDAEALDSTLEKTRLEEALKPLIEAKAVTIDWLDEANLLALARKLRPDTYHILHFIGHGGFDDTSGEGALLFEDEAGRGRAVSGDQLATILQNKRNLRLVLLNSCEGARNSVKDPFSGVATSLVQREIPAVIGMQFEITDRAAILFAGEFYAMLAEGQSVDAAIAEARLAIFADHNDVEWATPVLFMRIADGRLFDVTDATSLPRMAPETLPPKTETVAPVAAPVAAPIVAPIVAPTPSPGVPTPVGPGPAREASTPPQDAPTAPPDWVIPPGSQPMPTPLPQLLARVPWLKVRIAAAAAVAIVGVVLVLLPRPSTGSVNVNARGTHETGTIIVDGRDFAPGETVDLTIDGVRVGSAVAGDNGAFTTEIGFAGQTGAELRVVGRTSGREAGHSITLPATNTPAPSGTADSAAIPVDSPGILFYSNYSEKQPEATDNELYLIDPVTREIEQLTDNGADDTFATWSPDYTQIAYARRVEGSRDILTGPLRGSPTPLTSGSLDDFFPAWSRAGSIAFVRVNPDGGSSIWTVQPDGTGGRPLLSGTTLRAPAWSADGSRLALMSDIFAEDFDLTIINADGTGLEQFTTGNSADLNPNWSPDGTKIVFVMDRGQTGSGDNDLYLLDVATKTVERRLTENRVQDGNPVWSPDGTKIAFYRASAEGFHLWTMNADGTDQQDLMQDRPGRNLDPIWR